MLEYQLQLLAGAASVNIYKYADQTISPISAADTNYQIGFMINAAEKSPEDQYSLYRYSTGYILVVPVPTNEKLLVLPRAENFIQEEIFSSLGFLNETDALAKLVYFLYCGQIAPKKI